MKQATEYGSRRAGVVAAPSSADPKERPDRPATVAGVRRLDGNGKRVTYEPSSADPNREHGR